jgi:hypothetical protein
VAHIDKKRGKMKDLVSFFARDDRMVGGTRLTIFLGSPSKACVKERIEKLF